MREISVREVRMLLPRLAEVLAREGEIVITRRGKPLARLVPAGPAEGMPSHAEFRARMPRLDAGSERYVREDRDDR